MKSGIYTITNRLNGRIYVGCTVGFYDRFRLHRKSLVLGVHENSYLQNTYNKYGDVFDFEILEECEENLLPALEHYWVTILDTRNRKRGYNLRLTHPEGKIRMSEESKKKLSEYNKSIGKVPPSRKGAKASQETKALHRQNKLGNKHSEETKKKMSESQKRRYREEAQK